MQTSNAKRICDATGRPAFAEIRLGHGGAYPGSRYEGTFFVAIGPVRDGAYSDDEIDRMIEETQLVSYGNSLDGLLPASEIGEGAACELFRLGAAEIRDAIEGQRTLAGILMPLSLALCGQASIDQGADFMSLGRLWALAEYAKGVQPMRDLDPYAIGRETFQDIVRSETPAGCAAEAPEMRRLH